MADISSDNKGNSYSAKPPIFDGERFDYWKDRIKSFFLGFDMELWEYVTDGYVAPLENEVAIPLSRMTEDQKKQFRNHEGNHG